jgi:O-succinylbenzoate synthase
MGLSFGVSEAPRVFAEAVAPFGAGEARPALRVTLRADELSAHGEIVGWPGRRPLPDVSSVYAAGACVVGLRPERGRLQEALERLADPALVPGAAWAWAAAFAELVAAAEGVSLPALWRGEIAPLAGAPSACETTGLMLALGPPPPGRGMKLKIRPGMDAHAVRQLAGARPAGTLRLDGNHSLALREAELLAEASGEALQWLEEAVAPEDASSLGERWPVALDESLADGSLDDVARLIDATAARALILKPAVLGPARTLGLAALGASRGLSVVVSSLFEGATGLAALAALQAGLAPDVAAGLGTGRFLIAQDASQVGADGRLMLPLPSPGGVERVP